MDARVERTRASLTSELAAASALLTRLPVRVDRPATGGAGAFGLVGAFMGGIAALPLVVLVPVAPLAAGVLAVAILAVLSGGLHLDGLADTADALAAGDPARAEAARRDPRVGAAGATAIVIAVVLDASLLAALATREGVAFAAAACIVAAAGSRALGAAVPTIGGGRLRGDGAGAWFAAHASPASAVASVASAALIAFAVAFVTGSAVPPLGLAAGLGFGCLASAWLIRIRGALDGDGIGAIVEIGFGAILAALAVGGSMA